MEQLHNGFSLDICPGAFPLSTDSILLADFARFPRGANVLDLGSGCGTLGTLLCARDPLCRITGIELTEAAHQAALSNIQRNQLSDRMTSICADIRRVNQLFSPGSFHCCISNPPYFSGGAASQKTPLARRNDECSTDELFRAAAWALQYGGDFFIVQKPENLSAIFTCAVSAGLEPKRLCLVRHRSDKPISLILLQCRKGGKPGLVWEDLTLHNPDGSPTTQYRQIYHL